MSLASCFFSLNGVHLTGYFTLSAEMRILEWYLQPVSARRYLEERVANTWVFLGLFNQAIYLAVIWDENDD